MITEWEELEGRTIKRVVPLHLAGGWILQFENGEYALIKGYGEEIHGGHWPDLSDCEGYVEFIEKELKEYEDLDAAKELGGFEGVIG